tara:strand:+ start:133 stop:771 length:639 start_codon:yes stop_codon:yes gene_type:complete
MFAKKFFSFLAISAMGVGLTIAAAQADMQKDMVHPEIGAVVPDVEMEDSNGNMHKLSDFRDKYVVLQWSNYGCPFDKKHYESGNMQKLQREAGDDVVWLTVFSSAPGKQGHVTPAEANELMKKRNAAPTALIMDDQGELGQFFGAKTTPHMYVLDKKGVLVYAGAIDDDSSANPAATQTAKNYVMAALEDMRAGKPVNVAETRPYGCSVKYK